MTEISIIGIDLAKHSFQMRRAAPTTRRFSAGKCISTALLIGLQPRRAVTMKARGRAQDWGRGAAELGNEVRLVPPVCIMPFVKRQKTDSADAKATSEVALRPTMRFVATRARRSGRQRRCSARGIFWCVSGPGPSTRGYNLAAIGVIAAQRPAQVIRLTAVIADAESGLPEPSAHFRPGSSRVDRHSRRSDHRTGQGLGSGGARRRGCGPAVSGYQPP